MRYIYKFQKKDKKKKYIMVVLQWCKLNQYVKGVA